MNKFQKFVQNFSNEELVGVIKDYEELQQIGAIDDCLLRRKANEWGNIIDNNNNVILVMRDIAHEAFRYFAMLHLKQNDLL